MADENLENQNETQSTAQGEVQNAGANENRLKIGDGVYLEVTRVEVVGNLYDEGGAPLGDGNYAVNLDAEQVLELGIANIQPIADRFHQSGLSAE